MSILSSLVATSALADSNTADSPSEMFIDLYSKVFQSVDTYEVYDINGNCITDSFVSQYYSNYANSDFVTIRNAVANNGYELRYGEVQYVKSENLSRAEIPDAITVTTEWKYKLV